MQYQITTEPVFTEYADDLVFDLHTFIDPDLSVELARSRRGFSVMILMVDSDDFECVKMLLDDHEISYEFFDTYNF